MCSTVLALRGNLGHPGQGKSSAMWLPITISTASCGFLGAFPSQFDLA